VIIAPDGFERLPPLVSPLTVPSGLGVDPKPTEKSIGPLEAVKTTASLLDNVQVHGEGQGQPQSQKVDALQGGAETSLAPPIFQEILSQSIPSDSSVVVIAGERRQEEVALSGLKAYDLSYHELNPVPHAVFDA